MPRFTIFAVMMLSLAGMSLLLGRRDGSEARREAVAAPAVEGFRVDSFAVAGVPEEVVEYLRAGRSWRAARRMREHLEQNRTATPDELLLAARAEAGWGGWSRVREYLEGRSWLDDVQSGDGWYWLSRALEEDEEWDAALEGYGRYLRLAPPDAADRRVVAELRRGLILLRRGRAAEGAELLRATRERAPGLEPWIDILAAEALAEAGDTARVARLVAGEQSIATVRTRGRRALLRAYERSGDLAGARRVALSLRGSADSATERAELSYHAGRLALELGDRDAAREDLRAALATPAARAALDAARLLEDLSGLTASDRLALAGVYDRHNDNRRAAAGYRAWLDGNAGSAAERRDVRLRLGRALFDAGDYAGAETALAPLAEGDAPVAEAMLLTGRAQYRRGRGPQAMATFERLATRFPGSAEGSEGLFLVGDLSHDDGEEQRAAQVYQRLASDFRGTDRSGLAMMRLAGIRYLRGDHRAAARVWEEYRSLYPRGERWLEATYWAGRALEAAGDTAAARERYRAVREREPISYYALRGSERLDTPYWPITLSPSPADNPAARRRVEEWMRGVDLLREAGLHTEAEAEVDRFVASAGEDPALLYPLAETLNERGYTIQAIRIGQRLQRPNAPPSERLLRILYPFPYRAMVEAEAREKGLDPFLVAALARQESLFKARIASPVGARGLMQIMPETGATLARAVGIGDWDVELLYQPEINVHLGTRYLADQMRRYDGSLPSVFSAYNAGPHRIDQWRRFPEYPNEELFTERIPYRETREYVKILTRNIALYRGLYGQGAP